MKIQGGTKNVALLAQFPTRVDAFSSSLFERGRWQKWYRFFWMVKLSIVVLLRVGILALEGIACLVVIKGDMMI
jgi:hypothetical protein